MSLSIDRIHRRIRKLGGEGQLSIDDVQDFTESCQRIFCAMADGEWHTATDIEVAASPEGEPRMRSGLRRMRELRDLDGVDIERRRDGDSREYEYRLTIVQTQKSLY